MSERSRTGPGSAEDEPERARSRPPAPVRAAGVLVGAEGLVAVGFAVYLVARVGAGTLGLRAILGEAGMYLIIGAAVIAVGLGLVRGRFWSRTPAIVVQILLLPVGYSLLVPSHQTVLGAVVAVVVLATLGLLLSGPSRAWSEDLDRARRHNQRR